LNDENVIIPNRFENLDTGFSIGEFFDGARNKGNIEPVDNNGRGGSGKVDMNLYAP
jgi:hypothetical protein